MSTNSGNRHFSDTIASTAGGIQYRLQAGSPQIRQTKDEATATETYLIKSTDAEAFSAESFPPPVMINGVGFLPPRRRMPGTTAYVTSNLDFGPQSDEKVWDPMGVYSNENASFDDNCLVKIEYSTELDNDENERNPQDPVTFLERSITAGGQFLSIPPKKTQVQDSDVDFRNCTNATAMENGKPTVNGVPVAGQEVIDNDGGSSAAPNYSFVMNPDGEFICVDPQGTPAPDGACDLDHSGGYGDSAKGQSEDSTADENRDQELPILLHIPTVEYSLKWPLALNPFFGHIFRNLGRVNSDSHPIFWNAKRETILFTGVTATQKFVWTGAAAVAQPWNIEFRFSQRIINSCGRTYGWNHVYSPTKGRWVRVWMASGQPLYSSFSVKKFFG